MTLWKKFQQADLWDLDSCDKIRSVTEDQVFAYSVTKACIDEDELHCPSVLLEKHVVSRAVEICCFASV